VPDLSNVPSVPDLGSDLLGVALRSAIVYVFLVLALRLIGRREVGQLTIPDLVVLLVIANGVQNAMVGSNTTVLGGIVSAITVLVIARAVQIAVNRSRRFAEAFVGEPRILVTDGRVDQVAMREEEISISDLMEALHEHGIERLEEVHLAILEVDGGISVIGPEPRVATGDSSGHRTAGRLPQRRRVGRRARTAEIGGAASGPV